MKNRLEPRPYKLIGKIQNYDWGTKNEKAFIPKLLDIDAEKNKPYAEYWLGVHPKAPAEVLFDNDSVSLDQFISKYPDEILGKKTAEKYNNTLPFLLKILSINQALSIQSHPDKELAAQLNERDPEHYPDDNHKPEIAIALDKLKAIVGLKNPTEIQNSLEQYPEIRSLFSQELFEELNYPHGKDPKEAVKEIYSELMVSEQIELSICIEQLRDNFENKKDLQPWEKQFLVEFENYGADVGLISLLLFNWVELNSGEAIFTPAGIPHAYIEGNIIECMANSDNVIRAGLTPKFKDLKTLIEMIEVDSSKSVVSINQSQNTVNYNTDAEEFEIQKLLFLDSEHIIRNNKLLNIIIVIEGSIKIHYEGSSVLCKQGEAVLIPALLTNFRIEENEPAQVFSVHVPSNEN